MNELSPDELKLESPEIFNRVYEPSSDNTMVYTNTSRSVKVMLDGDDATFVEDLFICVSRWGIRPQYRTSVFIEYLVSKEYNVNVLSHWSKYHVAGRFVFNRVRDDRIVLSGSVEEPAKALYARTTIATSSENASTDRYTRPGILQMNVERLYLSKRSKNQPGKVDSLYQST